MRGIRRDKEDINVYIDYRLPYELSVCGLCTDRTFQRTAHNSPVLPH